MDSQEGPESFWGVVGNGVLRMLDTVLNQEKHALITFDDLIAYKREMQKEVPAIATSVVMIARQAEGFKVEQVFKSANGRFLFQDREKKDAYGRILTTHEIDAELRSLVLGKDQVTLTL